MITPRLRDALREKAVERRQQSWAWTWSAEDWACRTPLAAHFLVFPPEEHAGKEEAT